MEATSPTNPGLYAQVLGPQWHELAEVIRRLHAPARSCAPSARFAFAAGLIGSRFTAWLAGLPSECEAVEVHLTVTPTGTGEEWRRLFGGRPFTTTQGTRGGALVEQVGLSESEIRLEVIDGALHYQTSSAALRFGLLRIPLPGWLAPRATAWEKPDADRIDVFVEVRLPLLGRLISYEGTLTAIEVKSC